VVERRKDDGTYQAEPDHPLARLIKRPADNIDTETLWRCMEVSYSSLGKVYLEPLYTSRRRQLDGLMPLNPAWMKEETDGDGNLTSYRYEVPSLSPVVFGPNDLITRRAVLWAAPPPLIAALGAADADAVANQFISGFFSGGGIPSSIIKTRDDWTQERADDFRAEWVKRFSGANRQPAILGKSIESYERIGVSLNELDNETLRMYIETRLCMCFGVPPLIIYAYAGLLKSTYSNLDEAWESFWDATALPLLREWANWLTWSLLTLYEDPEAVRSGDVRCRFDIAGIGPYQEDVTAKVAMFSTGYKDRAVTLNEYRGAMGLSRIEGGDELAEPEPEPDPEPEDENKAVILEFPMPHEVLP
jgi:HK97 family phage portal protein